MNFETALADALYINWALPAGQLPAPPPPLTLDRALADGESFGFVTLVLFRQCGLRASSLGWPRLSFPQCNLRLPVRDADGVAAIWLLRELVPAWVVPLARGLARQPAAAAVFRRTGRRDEDALCWNVRAGRPLSLSATRGAPSAAAPRLGGWRETVAFFRDRPRGYVGGPKTRRIDTRHPTTEVLPMRAEILDPSWLEGSLPGVGEETWRRPHSAFLVPSVQMALEVESKQAVAVTVAPAPG